MKLPGTRMLALSRRIINPATVTRILEPLVADWQHEWLIADSLSRRSVARVHGLAAFLTSSAYCVMTDPVPRSVRRGAWTLLLVFSAIGVLILSLAYGPHAMPLRMLVLLMPGLLALSLPFAALPLAMKLGAARSQGPAGARHLVRMTMAIAALVFVMHNWAVPLANLAFRNMGIEIANSQRPAHLPDLPKHTRGARELTLPQLMRTTSATPGIMSSERQLHEERHNRASVPLIPIALAILGWSLAGVSGSSRSMRLAFWWAFTALTYGVVRSLGMTVERAWQLPREIAIWLPLLLWSLASLALIRSARNAAHLDNRSLPVQ